MKTVNRNEDSILIVTMVIGLLLAIWGNTAL